MPGIFGIIDLTANAADLASDRVEQVRRMAAAMRYDTAYAAEIVSCPTLGACAGWVGWPSIRAYHNAKYLGVPPSGKLAEWRLMDFYRREGDLVVENWVPVDMVHLFLTMGVDVFEELRKQI